MRTNYEQLRLRPASKRDIARRLMGEPGRTTGVAPVVRRPDVEKFFSGALGARNRIAPSGMDPYPLGGQGGLAGLGAVEAKFPVVGNIGFQEAWSFEDWDGKSGWRAHIQYWKLATYEPIDDMTRTRAQQKWDELQTAAQSGNEAAYQLLERWKNTISNAADAVDRNTKTADALGRFSDAGHRERARLLTALNTAIRGLANTTVPQAAPVPSGGGGWTPPMGGGVVGVGGEGRTPGAASQQGASMAASGGPPMGMLAFGAVALLGVGAVIIKKMRKKKG